MVHLTAAPGKSPPSPAKAISVQGIAGGVPMGVNVSNGPIPPFDYIAITYVGSTNNFNTVVYKVGGSGGTTVATLTFTYVGGTPGSNDALIASITKT